MPVAIFPDNLLDCGENNSRPRRERGRCSAPSGLQPCNRKELVDNLGAAREQTPHPGREHAVREAVAQGYEHIEQVVGVALIIRDARESLGDVRSSQGMGMIWTTRTGTAFPPRQK